MSDTGKSTADILSEILSKAPGPRDGLRDDDGFNVEDASGSPTITAAEAIEKAARLGALHVEILADKKAGGTAFVIGVPCFVPNRFNDLLGKEIMNLIDRRRPWLMAAQGFHEAGAVLKDELDALKAKAAADEAAKVPETPADVAPATEATVDVAR